MSPDVEALLAAYKFLYGLFISPLVPVASSPVVATNRIAPKSDVGTIELRSFGKTTPSFLVNTNVLPLNVLPVTNVLVSVLPNISNKLVPPLK